MSKKLSEKRFTYGELCLVLCLAALFAALLIPVVGKAQAAAKNVTCTDNLKTSIKATLAYADEYGGIAVLKYGDSASGKLLMTMAHGKAVVHNGKSAKRLNVRDIICPEVTKLPPRVTWHFNEFYAVPYGVYSNVHNIIPYERPDGIYQERKWPNADVIMNFKKIRYADSAAVYAEAWSTRTQKAHSTYGHEKSEGSKLDFRHAGKNNMAFVDGHVEGKALSYITEQRDASGLKGNWYVLNEKREIVGL